MVKGWMMFQSETHQGIVNPEGKEIAIESNAKFYWLGEDFAVIEGISNPFTGLNTWPSLIARGGKIQKLKVFNGVGPMPVGIAARKLNENQLQWYDADLKLISNMFIDASRQGSGGVAPVMQGDKWGLMGADQKWRREPTYLNIDVFSYGLASFVADNGAGTTQRQGFISPQGAEIVIPHMSAGDCFGHYLFVVHDDRQPGFYTRDGRLIELINVVKVA